MYRVAGCEGALAYGRNGMQLWPTHLRRGDMGAIHEALQLHHGWRGAAAGRGAGRRSGRQTVSSGDIKRTGPFVQAPWPRRSCCRAMLHKGEVPLCEQDMCGRARIAAWLVCGQHAPRVCPRSPVNQALVQHVVHALQLPVPAARDTAAVDQAAARHCSGSSSIKAASAAAAAAAATA